MNAGDHRASDGATLRGHAGRGRRTRPRGGARRGTCGTAHAGDQTNVNALLSAAAAEASPGAGGLDLEGWSARWTHLRRRQRRGDRLCHRFEDISAGPLVDRTFRDAWQVNHAEIPADQAIVDYFLAHPDYRVEFLRVMKEKMST